MGARALTGGPLKVGGGAGGLSCEELEGQELQLVTGWFTLDLHALICG